MTETLVKQGIAQDWAEVKPLLEKVICRIKTSQRANDFFSQRKGQTLFDGIADAAGNHVFDDCYGVFKISEIEGHLACRNLLIFRLFT